MEKAEPFGFRKGSITVTAPPIELNPEIILPDINIPDIKLPPVTVQVAAPIVKCDPVVKVTPVVQMPEAKGWRFVIHKLKNGDIEMTAKPL